MKYSLENVSSQPELWKDGDPVRPQLGVSYKTYPGREVFGLKDEGGDYVAFCCVARTWDVPKDVMSLSSLTSEEGTCYIPYTVWSLKKGSGKAIINALLDHVRNTVKDVRRVVTLSPNTEMARSFHLRNGAKEISTYIVTANFEYAL
mgnify:CR=1 FL=1